MRFKNSKFAAAGEADSAPKVMVKTLAYTESQEWLLRRLASALVIQWNTIPDDVQDVLIDQAIVVEDRVPAIPERDDFEHFIRAVRDRPLRPAAPASVTLSARSGTK